MKKRLNFELNSNFRKLVSRRITYITLFLFFISLNVFSQAGNNQNGNGEVWSSASYNDNGVGDHATITYYSSGYYEGYKLNINDIVKFHQPTPGGTSYYATGTSYTIDGTKVWSSGGKPGDHFITIGASNNLALRIATQERRTNQGSSTNCNVLIYIKSIPWTFNPPAQICQTASQINLRDYIKTSRGNYSGGSFPRGTLSGTGVSGNYFYPGVAGVGSHTITFTYEEKTVVKTISVVAPSVVTESFPATIYNTNSVGGVLGRMDLRSYVNPTGGTFQVFQHSNGSSQTLLDERYLNLFGIIPENRFSPTTSEDISVIYTYTNGPCTQSITKTVSVINNNINLSFADFPEICADNKEYDFKVLSSISPTGGIFSAGSGLRLFGEGNSFFTADREGSYPITYTVTQNGYSKSATKHLRIREIPDVSFNRVPTICFSSNVDLTSYVEPLGGTFSGTGINGNEFNPVTAGIGEHVISYSFSNDYGCQGTASSIITVLELIPDNITFNLPANICQDAGTISLKSFVTNHEGGTFSGLGVTGDYLDLSLAGTPGMKTITYKIKNGACVKEYTSTFNLRPRPTLVFNNVSNICTAGTVIDLFDYVTPKDKGSFSGNGVVDNKFYASTAGKGSHVITFTYTDSNGCTNQISKTIIVSGLIPQNVTFDNISSVCSQSTTINLREYVNVAEGTFSGRGVSGDVFNPGTAGIGTHQITFTYRDDVCTKTLQQTITVQGETVVTFNSVPTVCFNNRINLMSYVGAHTGGTFFGSGVTDNYFYPQIAGIGEHVISYSYTNTSNCETIVSQTIKVDHLIDESIVFESIPDKCVSSSSIYLRDYINTETGTFSGRGVTGQYFNPASAGIGTWTITWQEKNGNCTNSKTTTVNVISEPAVVFNTLPKVCYQDQIIDLNLYIGGYTGGVFSGPGVSNGKFYAEQAGVGTHTLSYLYSEGECEVLKQQTIIVSGLLNSTVVFSPISGVCVTGSTINLEESVNVSGGVFSGPGVTGTYFNPSAAGTGLKKITYTLTHGTCSESHEQIIDVQNLTSFTFNDLPIVCSSSPIYLNNYITPFRDGGSFAGKGVVDNIFYPENAEIGQHLITYSYTNSYGCETILTKTISVDQLLGEISWNDVENLCKTSSPIYLPDYIQGHVGGTFSGQGVNGEYFNPSNVNPGNYTIKYKVTGGRCNVEISTVIVVSQGPSVTFNTIAPICYEQQINLNNYVSHTGINASFSGPGVDGNFFNPTIAGRGLHTLTYSYQNTSGCETILTQVVNVVDLLKEVVFNDLPSICESSPAVVLSDYIENHSGGIFSGPGVQGNVFNPSAAGKGLHLITYTISNGSCFIELQKNIEVFPQETVVFNPVNDLCYISKVDLTRYVSPAGGVFSGIGIIGNDFDPLLSGIGSFLIEYTFTSSNGCKTIAKQTINVVDLVQLDITFNALPEVCENGTTVYLPDYVDHEGGTFSGRGVTGNYFNPAVAGKGSHLITYLISKGSCKIEVQEVVHVFPPDEIVFSTIPNVCYDAPINLQNYVSPQGGIFSGSGVEDGFFHPANVGLGDYTVSYQYTNAKGCLSTVTKVIKVINLLSSNIVFSALPDVCPESSIVNLREYVNSVEGEFVGRGVTDDYFDPKVAGPGVHKIEFRIIDGACRTERFQSIIVKQPVAITFEKVPEVCAPNTIDLSSFVVPKGGQFAGNGVTGNIFNPITAGIGQHEITYLINDGSGCTNQIKQTITVTNLIPKDLALNRIEDICTNSASVKLSDYLSHNLVGGTFSGPGVSGEYFNPSGAGKGVHQITYTIGQGNCRLILKETITVKGKDDNVVFYTLPEVCINKQIDLADYISKHIGQFSGVGVVNNKFNPGTAGIGTHTISYLYENDLNCEFVLSQDIVVRDLMPANISFSALPDVCPDNAAVKLSDYTNYTGTFSGPGVSGEYFNPSNVNPGTYTINFTFSSGICQGTKKQTITVKRREEVFFTNIQPICKGKAIDLTQYVFPQGGTFSGPGIAGDKFYPSLSGSGKHVITYQYVNELNCPSIIQKEIEVLEMINSDIQFMALPDICVNSTPIKLSEYLKNGDGSGKFSGTGVEGEYFNPLTAGPGAWTITYQVGNTTTCKESFIQTLVVHSNEDVIFSQIPVTCTHQPINLFDYVSHKTGTFSGPGVQDNVFNPALAGTGNHMIVYNYKSHTGCESVLTTSVNVPRIYSNVSFNPIGEICQNGLSISLSDYVNVAGGNFSGTGVENNLFNPSLAQGGTHQITYTIGDESCQVQTTEMITVIGIPEIEFKSIPEICFNELIRLDDYVTHKGNFSGRGVSENIFNPQDAGQGAHKITFSYNQNGCQVTLTTTINVLALNDSNVEFFRIEEMCVNAVSIDLSMFTNSKGNFTGPGVQGNIFNPQIAGSGTHELVLNVGQGSCARQYRQYVTVYNTTPLISEEIIICNGQSIDLNDYVNIQGGTFQGQYVAANYFYPERIGEFIVRYSYENRNGCSSSIQFPVKVQGMHPENIEFLELPNVCSTDAVVDLRKFVSFHNNESVFSGSGVQGYYFSPQVAKAGVHQISFVNGSGTCKSTLLRTIQVNSPSQLTFNLPSKICNEASIDLESLTNVEGGVFSGPGVSSNTLYPASAGIGTHLITLTFQNSSGCISTLQKSVQIQALNPEEINFLELPDICVNQGRIRLSDFVSDAKLAVFSGPGVNGQYFYPNQAGSGTHMITCQIGLTSGCVDSYSQVINVLELPQVVFSALPEVCFNTPINLANYVSLEGGYFAGPGISEGYFYPDQAERGDHQISYIIQDDYSCETVITQTLTVRSLFNPEISFSALPNVCVNAENVNLVDYVSEFVGAFSGPGVTNTMFSANQAGPGTHAVKYTVGTGSCANELIQYVTVYPLTNVEFSTLPIICNGQSIDLNEYVNIQGGTFQGQFITESVFSPERIGEFVIRYFYANGNGCTSSVESLIKVQGMHPVNVEFLELPGVCSNDAVIDLREYVSFYNNESVFSGPGVEGYYFSPQVAKAGVHQISFVNGSGTCKSTLLRTIQVNSPSQLTFNLPSKLCNEASIDLESLTNVEGGVFSGPGVNANKLHPALAGIGTHLITLTYQNSSGCISTLQKSVQIQALNPEEVNFLELPDVCVNQGRIRLSDFVSDAKLPVFSGPGVNGQYFYPNQAGSGTHMITCQIGLTSGCVDSYSQVINVLELPQVVFSALPEVCFNTPVNLANYVSLEGGHFAGPGISEGYFYPDQSERGDHQISYIIQDDYGCETVVTQTLTVRSLFNPEISFSALPNICVNAENVNLMDYVSEFVGAFSGPGVTNTMFSASKAGIGTHAIKYTVGTGTCARELTQYVTVYPLTNVEFSALPIVCYNSVIDLENYVSPIGGTFSGQGVSGSQINTESLEVGTYTISYSFLDGNGCRINTSQVLEVNGKNPLEGNMEFSAISDVCLGSAPIDLREFVSVEGGVFSGIGVTGNLFNPSSAGIGVHLISYSFGVGQCQMVFQQEIIVKNAPVVQFSPLPGMCQNSDEIVLSNYVSHQGGTFEGTGIENGILKRSLLSKGSYTLYYHYATNDGCNLEIPQTITVGDVVPEDLEFTTPGEICENGGTLNLFTLMNSENGTFSGAGVDENGYFQPAVAGEGTHRITFTLGQGDCQVAIHKYINVAPPKNVEFTNIEKVCGKDPIPLMDFVNYKGGTFSGRGVSNNIFDPTIAGEGIHKITYTFSDELCQIQVTQNVEVLNTRDLKINVDRSAVESSALVRFWSEGFEIKNYRWEFGDGGYSLEKEPFHYYYHTGEFDVTLICEDQNGCSHTLLKEKFLSVSSYNEDLKSSVIVVNDPAALVGVHYMDSENKEHSSKDISIYPNPFTDHIKLSSLPIGENCMISINDINGRILFTGNSDGLSEKTILLDHLSSGMYFIRIDEKVMKIIKK